MRLVTLAPAKVNLVLRVGPPRPDGFHDIASLMVPLDLGDRVEVRVGARRGPVACRVPGRPELDGPGNLAARAAEGFRARFGLDRAVTITIAKRTPVTAGLGGGSSDAAAVLRCLARAHPVPDGGALAEVGLAVGSDVPFFLGSGPAWAAGRGERLRPAVVPPLDLVLVYPRDPALAIRAGDAYRWLDERRRGERVPVPRAGGPFRITRVGNDLQPGCEARHPALGPLLGLLVGSGATVAMMSGSGPTLFGLASDRAAARRIARLVAASEGERVEVFAVRTATRAPRVSTWRSPRSASSQSMRTSSRRT